MQKTSDKHKPKKSNNGKLGLLALSPLVVFLVLYFTSSLIAKDFYAIPISATFLIASIYALTLCRKKTIEERIDIFSSGAGNKNVLLMIWIFILAGSFAKSADAIGAIDQTVNFALSILPGKFIYAGLFIAACFISMAIGTSVGTIVALVPLASGIAEEIGSDIPFVTAIIVGGAFFGDNLSFISDTTIASTRTQGCKMADKFKANIRIIAPAAVIITIVYLLLGQQVEAIKNTAPIDIIKLLPYFAVIILALGGINVTAVLTIGIGMNAIIGFSTGCLTWNELLTAIGKGIAEMGDLIIVTMLAGGMLAVIKENGGLDYILEKFTNRIRGKRGAEFAIAGLVSLANICTANNTIAIITTGGIAKDISTKYGLSPKRVASILDTFSCLIQGFLPYGAQLLMAAGLAGISSISIMTHLYYPFTMGIFAILSILFRPSR